MSERAPIWNPLEDEPRFLWGDASHAVERVVKPTRPDLRVDAPAPRYVAPEFIVVNRRPYASPALDWHGWVFVAEQDEERLLVAMQAAEAWILFVAWLRAIAR